jgi:hypothetical protein
LLTLDDNERRELEDYVEGKNIRNLALGPKADFKMPLSSPNIKQEMLYASTLLAA